MVVRAACPKLKEFAEVTCPMLEDGRLPSAEAPNVEVAGVAAEVAGVAADVGSFAQLIPALAAV